MSEGFRTIELPDTDRDIARIVSKEEVVNLARELRERYDLSDDEISQILNDSSKIFEK